jgi:DNA-binding CsgD family transcriptional regulator
MKRRDYWRSISYDRKKELVLAMTKRGMTPTQICAFYGTHNTYVHKLVSEIIAEGSINANTPVERTFKMWEKMTHYQKEQYCARHFLLGKSFQSIAVDIGATEWQVDTVVQNLINRKAIDIPAMYFVPRKDIEPLTRELDEYSAHYADAIYEDDRAPDVWRDYPQWPISSASASQTAQLG